MKATQPGEQCRRETISLDQIRRRISRYREPQFKLPARFIGVSFESFETSPDRPEHAGIIARIGSVVAAASRGRRFWERWRDEGPRGIYLLGPPGVGKTHLLAAAYQEASEPKIFASFDELAAAAGTLGAHALGDLLARQRFVCVDEITLDDPGNIMLLTSLMRRMLQGEPWVLASANFHPDEADNHPRSMSSFKRELGQIAAAFEIVPLRGQDHRPRLGGSLPPPAEEREGDRAILACAWDDLLSLLDDTHPMHDADWLEEIGRLEITSAMTAFTDQDRALRFVRFIDRVYDCAVALRIRHPVLDPDVLLAPLQGERHFMWHLARCRSRLMELLLASGASPAPSNAAIPHSRHTS